MNKEEMKNRLKELSKRRYAKPIDEVEEPVVIMVISGSTSTESHTPTMPEVEEVATIKIGNRKSKLNIFTHTDEDHYNQVNKEWMESEAKREQLEINCDMQYILAKTKPVIPEKYKNVINK